MNEDIEQVARDVAARLDALRAAARENDVYKAALHADWITGAVDAWGRDALAGYIQDIDSVIREADDAVVARHRLRRQKTPSPDSLEAEFLRFCRSHIECQTCPVCIQASPGASRGICRFGWLLKVRKVKVSR